MSRSKTTSRKSWRRRKTLAEVPFHILVEKDMELKNLHAHYAGLPAEQCRQAAQWAFDSSHASMLMADAVNKPDLVHVAWHNAAAPLAIDPEYAPAMFTVGSLEYQYGRVEEAMALFLNLTTLPADTEDLEEIIDKAGDFLIDQGDHVHSGQLYAAAVRAYPQVALYYVGLGYCAAEGGRMEESVAHHRRAVKLEPNSYLHLNDLGYSLLEARQYDEAEEMLQLAVQLAPPDYDLAKGNLEHLRKVRSESREQRSKFEQALDFLDFRERHFPDAQSNSSAESCANRPETPTACAPPVCSDLSATHRTQTKAD